MPKKMNIVFASKKGIRGYFASKDFSEAAKNHGIGGKISAFEMNGDELAKTDLLKFHHVIVFSPGMKKLAKSMLPKSRHGRIEHWKGADFTSKSGTSMIEKLAKSLKKKLR